MVFDSGSAKDRHALARLANERIAWLTTVTAEGQPQTFPIWFIPDGADLVVYSLNRAQRLANLAANPHVSFHLADDGSGGDILVIEGTARVDPSTPLLPDHVAYCARYADWIAAFFETPTKMAEQYSVPIRITPVRAKVSGGSSEAEA